MGASVERLADDAAGKTNNAGNGVKTMSDFSNYAEACSTGYFADEDAARCGCGGRGWFLSELDVWYRCPVHYWRSPWGDGPDEESSAEEIVEFEAKVDAMLMGVATVDVDAASMEDRAAAEWLRLAEMRLAASAVPF